MSSIIIIPDELLTGNTTSHATDNANYTFTLNETQRDIITRLYKGQQYQNVQIQMQFLQSSNQLESADQQAYYANRLQIEYVNQGIPVTEKIFVSGTFYSISEFYTTIQSQLTLPGIVAFTPVDNILQNEGLWNLRCVRQGAGITDIKITYFGYQLCQMLGLTHGIENEIEWDYVTDQTISAPKHFYCPVIKQFNFESTLQSKANIYYDERGNIHNLIARVINSIQQGDYCNVTANIQVPSVDIEQLFQFHIDVYDSNFVICRFLDDFRACLTFSGAQQADIAKIISNRSV